MDDDRPVDAAIRPVLPSRRDMSTPSWQDAGAVANARAAQDPKAFPLPPKPARTRKEKPVKKPKDKKRSTIAKAAWQTRRKNAAKTPIETDFVKVVLQCTQLLNHLPLPEHKRALSIMTGLLEGAET